MALQQASDLNGAWRLLSGEFVEENGLVTHYDEAGVSSIKLLIDGHFSFTSSSTGGFYGCATGRYEVRDGGEYIESPLLAYNPSMLERQFAFKARLDGDTWINERWENGLRVELETWQRIRE
ncbi:hypothetical protein [Amantichitinum ursilacus]|uniref:Lipocalin-like domain-containing protein n=1 Tax=Amantichitinum ursilacus TaxID=857265 RepID=A0A0N0XKH1_9NEIS|nr:hypothetical protein [Amantichitinum ursilacus]KPC52769.1 hypothetical protein WG78_13015 [Amantichitinum ursilacus]